MIDKGDKMLPISKEHAVQLNLLMQNKNYPALQALYRVEEHNIKEAMASLDPMDPILGEKCRIFISRLRQLRYLNGYMDKIKRKVKHEPDSEN